MAYRGYVKNGTVVLDEETNLPEGTEVTVQVVKPAAETLSQVLLRHAGTIKDLPPDASKNLDHYLYGLPKK